MDFEFECPKFADLRILRPKAASAHSSLSLQPRPRTSKKRLVPLDQSRPANRLQKTASEFKYEPCRYPTKLQRRWEKLHQLRWGQLSIAERVRANREMGQML